MARQQVTDYRTRVRWANPASIAQAVGLGWLFGKAIAGDNGAVRYGGPGDIQSNRTAFTGYAFPPQMFIGYSARRVAAGAIRNNHAGLPNSKSPASLLASPLQRAMATVTAQQIAGQT